VDDRICFPKPLEPNLDSELDVRKIVQPEPDRYITFQLPRTANFQQLPTDRLTKTVCDMIREDFFKNGSLTSRSTARGSTGPSKD